MQRIISLELFLGRVPAVLAWMEIGDGLLLHLEAGGKAADSFREQRKAQELALLALLLSADLHQLAQLDFLPDILLRRDLMHAAAGLLFTLGHEERLEAPPGMSQAEVSEQTRRAFEELLSRPERADLPEKPELVAGARVMLRTTIIGVRISVDACNRPSSPACGIDRCFAGSRSC